MKSKNRYLYYSILPCCLLLIAIGIYVSGYNPPTQGPPYGNLPAPINASLDEQTKAGNLIIEGNLTTGGFKMLTGAGADKVLTTNASGIASWQTPAGGSLWTQTGNNIYYNTGNVGIGTTNPGAKLEVAGGVKVANDTAICDASKAGTIRWTGTNFQGCNGTIWTILTNFLSTTGGTITYIDGYTFHTFTSSGAFAVTSGAVTANVFLVGGGGGGSARQYGGGGGGAGGYTLTQSITVAQGESWNITIGAGGAGVGGSATAGTGIASTISRGETTYSAAGGNGGVASTGGNGGSGGGSAGKAGASDGASAVVGGTGQGTTTRAFGEVDGTLYSGGGGGGHTGYVAQGSGGAGGGGRGGQPNENGIAGAANTGGAAGGGGYSDGGGIKGGTGGTGIVIIRFISS